MRSVGMTWSKWFTCDRCGFDYPVKYKRRQNGLSVCTYLPCFDTIIPGPDPLTNFEEVDFEVDLEALYDGI